MARGAGAGIARRRHGPGDDGASVEISRSCSPVGAGLPSGEQCFGPVSTAATRQAIGWAEYLESHARRAYASLSVDNAEAARSIWRRVKRCDLTGPFTARDIQRKGWSGLNDKQRIAAGLGALLDADWIGARDANAGERGGRPSTIYLANPKAMKG